MNITAGELELIGQWNARLAQPVSLRFVRSPHPAVADFEAFLNSLRDCASIIEVVSEKGEESELPAIHVGKALRYHAIPTGNELEPFLEALSPARIEQSEELGKLLSQVQWPAEIKVYVTSHCPFCPRVIKQVQRFALANPLIGVTVIDGFLFPEMANEDGVRSVPTTILDGRFRWTGVMRPEEILEVLLHRDPSELSAGALKNFLKEGNALRLADMMLERNLIFPAFIELLLHPDWSVRMGAMVVAEEMGERNPKLASELLPVLWERMESVQDSVKGDMVYLIGTLGSADWVPMVERFKTASGSEDLCEIAEEAMEKLRLAHIEK